MKRYFLPIEKALELNENIGLTNNNLVVLSKDDFEGFNLRNLTSFPNLDLPNILTLSSTNILFYQKNISDFDIAVNYFNEKNERLLYEITESDYYNLQYYHEALIYEKHQNGKYISLDNHEKRTIKLIEYGALKSGLLKDFSDEELKTLALMPSLKESNAFYLSNLKTLYFKDSIVMTRNALKEIKLGGDLYLYTENEEILDQARTYITEITEHENNYYKITNKNYYLVKPFSNKEKRNLSLKEIKLYNELLVNYLPVYLDEDLNLSTDKPEHDNYTEEILVPRENLEHLLKDGFKNMPFKELITVINQNINGFQKISLEDALDKPRTYVSDNLTSEIDNQDIYRFHVFYEHDPKYKIPDILKDGNIVEFEKECFTKEGHPIYKKSPKIVQKMTNEEYSEYLKETGNKLFIEVTGLKNEAEIFSIFGESGLLHEFVLYEELGSSYYVTRPYKKENNLKKSR